MKTGVKVVTVLAAVLFLALAAVLFSLWRSVPPLSGRASLPGLGAEVRVTFDSLGIPRIAAASDEDAFAALGYLHARDRLWAMEMMRRAAEGRLSEVVGSPGLDADRYLRALDVPRAAQASLDVMAPATRRMLDAYLRGVNAWIAAPGRPLPPEFRVLGFKPAPWTARQSLEIAKLMAWDLQAGNTELRLARQLARIGPERIRELFPPDDSGPSIVTPAPTAFLRASEIPVVPELAEEVLDWSSMSRASNSWVIGGARTASGKPILANDPHLELRAPSLWYLAAIESPGYQVAGATIPGMPSVILGHNRRIAWGWTNGSVDDVDYVIERFSADTTQYLTSAGWRPVEVIRDSIPVKGRPAAPVLLRRTIHGPILWPSPSAPGDTSGPRLLALRWNAQDPSDELSATLALNRAGDWNAFLDAARQMKAPEQNWIYADVDGNIGYTLTGNVPVRRGGNGLLPTPGWTDEGRWERYLTFDELPRVYNPAEGFIVTANNRVVGPGYPHLITADWELPHRAARIRELILAGNRLTTDDVRHMQMDTLDVFARWAKTITARAADSAGRPDVAAALRAWDGTMGADRTEPTIFYVWYRTLQRLTFEDELAPAPLGPGDVFQGMLRAGASPWFDDTRTPAREDLDALSARAMREALPVAGTKRWGEVHQSVSRHALGRAKPLELALRVNIGPEPRAGSLYTVNVADFGAMEPPFVNTHAASFRQVVDMAAPGDAGFIITSGQSGNPLSRHYRDQKKAWYAGRLVRIASGGSVLTLVPEER